MGALVFCVVSLIGLSVYIVIDYYKYKDIIVKLKDINSADASMNYDTNLDSMEQDVNTKKENVVNNNLKQKGKHF